MSVAIPSASRKMLIMSRMSAKSALLPPPCTTWWYDLRRTGDDEKTKAMKALLNNSSCTSLTYYLSLVLPSASLSLSVRRALFLGT